MVHTIKLTPFEQYEMLHIIDIRIDTVNEDPDSATPFESPSNLECLRTKLMGGASEFTDGEIEWLKEEAEELLSKCQHNTDNGDDTAKRDLPICKAFLSKLSSL